MGMTEQFGRPTSGHNVLKWSCLCHVKLVPYPNSGIRATAWTANIDHDVVGISTIRGGLPALSDSASLKMTPGRLAARDCRGPNGHWIALVCGKI